MLLYQTPGRRPPRVTGCVVSIGPWGWVAARNEHAPSRFRDSVVGFVYQCLSRTRNLTASKQSFSRYETKEILDRWQWKCDVAKFSFQTIHSNVWAEDTLELPLWAKRGRKHCFSGQLVHAPLRGGTCAFTLKIVARVVNTMIKNSSCDDRPSIRT